VIRTRGGANFCPGQGGKGSGNTWAERNGDDAARGRRKRRIMKQPDGFARKSG
jgi:hypothetical protein